MYFFLFISAVNAQDSYTSLWETGDPKLQSVREALVQDKGLMPQAAERLSLVLADDISDIHQPRVAAMAGNLMVYAASLPKIAIMPGAFVQLEQGKLKLDASLIEDMTDTLRYSNIAAATRMLERAGREELLEILISRRYRLYDKDHGGGLWVGKDYENKALTSVARYTIFHMVRLQCRWRTSTICWIPQSTDQSGTDP